ncbi:MAG: ROK family protein [Lachnospiraceae bacterium]|jgi:fructokinase|nr:ROK family protein [Lachnospiraceae bacterium]
MRYGALEAGGTKMVCAIGNENGEILEQKSFPTVTPKETLPKLVDYFRNKNIDALGIACFGPVDLNKDSETYGFITSTTKLAWQNTDVVGCFKELGVPIGFDTDVNGSVLGEYTWGIGKGLRSCIYITFGTGVGVGVISDGRLMHGMMHPEGGHVLLQRQTGDTYEGSCPFHHDCVESLASGSAIKGRWGKAGVELQDRPEVWDLEAEYISQALVDYTMVLSPQRIILGGGVMHQTQILPLIRKKFAAHMNGYIRTREIEDLDSFIVCQSLDDKQGIMGAVKLAMMETGH